MCVFCVLMCISLCLCVRVCISLPLSAPSPFVCLSVRDLLPSHTATSRLASGAAYLPFNHRIYPRLNPSFLEALHHPGDEFVADFVLVRDKHCLVHGCSQTGGRKGTGRQVAQVSGRMQQSFAPYTRNKRRFPAASTPPPIINHSSPSNKRLVSMLTLLWTSKHTMSTKHFLAQHRVMCHSLQCLALVRRTQPLARKMPPYAF